jgi:tetratricopeptide repeat protein 30
MSTSSGRLTTGTLRLKTGITSSYALATNLENIPPGKITATIYSLIRDNQFQKVIKLLQDQPKTQQTLSLLGYCHYQLEDYPKACDIYEDLVKLSDSDDYRFYYASSLFKSAQYLPAQKVCQSISLQSQNVIKLEALILYELGEFQGCKNIINTLPNDLPDTHSDTACLLLKVFSQFQLVGR